MGLTIGDNFNYRGRKPNFERDSFATLGQMRSFPETSIDDGHLAFCAETRKTYRYDSVNEPLPDTGRWRVFAGITSVKVPELQSDYVVSGNPSATEEVVYYIHIGAELHNVLGDSTIKWKDGLAPFAEESCIMVVSVMNNLGVWGIFK